MSDENQGSTRHRFIPLPDYEPPSQEQCLKRSRQFYEAMNDRRSVREFSDRPVPEEVVRNCIRAAGTAPSGANLQPWQFVVVTDPAVKRQIRAAAEEEERRFYEERATNEWLEALEPLGTDHRKPFLEVAPYLIVVFARTYDVRPDGSHVKHYYVSESVGIACGLLLAAIHHAGLVALTHTPSPMGFLSEILQRPRHERPYLLVPIGYPAADARVPDISRRPLDEILEFV